MMSSPARAPLQLIGGLAPSSSQARSPRLPLDEEADKPYSYSYDGGEEEEDQTVRKEQVFKTQENSNTRSDEASSPSFSRNKGDNTKKKNKKKKKPSRHSKKEEEEEDEEEEKENSEKIIIIDTLESVNLSSTPPSATESTLTITSSQTKKRREKEKEKDGASLDTSPSPSLARRKKKKKEEGEGKPTMEAIEGEEDKPKEKKSKKKSSSRNRRSASTSAALTTTPSSFTTVSTVSTPSSPSTREGKSSRKKSSSSSSSRHHRSQSTSISLEKSQNSDGQSHSSSSSTNPSPSFSRRTTPLVVSSSFSVATTTLLSSSPSTPSVEPSLDTLPTIVLPLDSNSSSSLSTASSPASGSASFSSFSSSSPFDSSFSSAFQSLATSSTSPPLDSSVPSSVSFVPHPSASYDTNEVAAPSSLKEEEEEDHQEVIFLNMPRDKVHKPGDLTTEDEDEEDKRRKERRQEKQEQQASEPEEQEEIVESQTTDVEPGTNKERQEKEEEEEEEEEEDNDEDREPTEEEKRATALKNRNNIAKEILETEESYVASLKLLLDMYITPLRDSMKTGRGILSEEDLKRIFSTVELIYNLNNTLLGDLKQRIENWHERQLIGDVFLQFAPMFKLYSDYVKNYAVAMVHLQFCTEKYSKFATFLKEAAAANRQVLGIHTFLIMPVQRLPRYILLLNEMKKNTSEDHPDRNTISKSVVIFQQVTDQVNKSIKIAENISKIVAIQSSLIGKINLVDPARKFVKEGLLTKITSRFIKECMFYLFNDILIYTYPMLGYFQYKGTIVLGPSWLRDLQDTAQVKNSFQIVCKQKTYTVFAPTPEIKKEWMTSIQQQIDILVELQPELIAQRSEVKVNQRGGIWKLFQKGLSYRPEDFDVEAGNAIAPPPPPPTLLTATAATAGTPLLGGTADTAAHGRVGLFKIDDLGAAFYEGGWCRGSCCTIL